MSLRIGCSGWSYADWVGPFYPEDTVPNEYLSLYSKVFDCVEIDSTFYRAPSPSMVQQWYSNTAASFVFAPKLPKRITHDQHLEDVSSYLAHFTATLEQLKEKLGPFVIQLPPSFKLSKHERALANFLAELNPKSRYAVEFRHKSWFNPTTEKLLESQNICQVWSINQYLSTPAAVTSDIIYLRLVGDRKIREFKETQRDQTELMQTWKRALENVGGSVKERFVFFNNHFAGFGPGSVNEFRRLMGLAELDWKALKGGPVPQRTLFDFSK
ncbi:MAG TPA: DUF72 domain-containing protein [Candidatus Dormibacteraeota bacterium]|nr:DUF72 domain-containing protein [Candidatus Dormibacteraeota bacterium]